MARIKRTIIIRRGDDVARKDAHTPQRKITNPKPTRWEKAGMTGDVDLQREYLTKSQWREHSELRRTLKILAPGIIVQDASLNDLRDMMYSTTRCQINRLIA